MGLYINIGNAGFQSARNGEYVDKSGMISVINATLNTEQRFCCVSRARRFGKSMAAKMLCAYYDHSCDSRELFADLEIASDPSFEKHLNKYPVLYVDMSDFMGRFDAKEIVGQIQQCLKQRMQEVYPEVKTTDADDLMDLLVKVTDHTKQQFIFIIDEWDAICRNDYHFHREYASGKGFADLVLLPRKQVASPAVVIELKYGDTADTALAQIRQRNYPAKIAEYTGDLLLVGISYDRQSKQHACRIERMRKD